MDTSSGFSPGGQGRDEVSPLSVVRAAFDRIADDPVPGEVASLVGLDAAVVTWGQLRRVLADPGAAIEVVDAVWVWLIGRARAEGSDAAVVCAGMAVPMLAGMARTFGPRRRADRADVESDLLAVFFAELQRVDLERPFLWFRLRWAVFRGGRMWVRREAAAPVPSDVGAEDGTGSGAPEPVMWSPAGHPEDLLTEAVAEKVISAEVAELIACTRLEKRSVTSLGTVAGCSHWALRKARQRGEHELVRWLAARRATDDPGRTSSVEHRALHNVACAGERGRSDLAVQLRLTGRDIQVLRLLAAVGGLSAGQVAECLFPSVDTARRRLAALARRGVVTRVRAHPVEGVRGVPPWHYTLSPLGTEIIAQRRDAADPRPRPLPAQANSSIAPASRLVPEADCSRALLDTAQSKSGSSGRSSQCGRTSAAPAYPATVEVTRRCA